MIAPQHRHRYRDRWWVYICGNTLAIRAFPTFCNICGRVMASPPLSRKEQRVLEKVMYQDLPRKKFSFALHFVTAEMLKILFVALTNVFVLFVPRFAYEFITVVHYSLYFNHDCNFLLPQISNHNRL